MAKLIAIWGSPNSGKTTLAVKLGTVFQEIGLRVYTVFADNTIPTLPIVFPNMKSSDMYSMGPAISKAETTQRDIETYTVTTKAMPNVGYLGYKDGENLYSYPQADEIKYWEFLMVLKDMADIVIVDCTSLPDRLSKTAMAHADSVIRVASADLKSICFFSSQLPILADPKLQCDKHIIVLNENADDVCAPVYEAAHYFIDTAYTLPYCQDIRIQSFTGELFARPKNKKYNKLLNELTNRLLE